MQDSRIDILGRQYSVLVGVDGHDDEALRRNSDGYCDHSIAKIVVARMEEGIPGQLKDMPRYARKVTRHEIIHAFLFESGLGECSKWAGNEEMVDWFAFQFPKLVAAFREAGCLE